MSSWPKKRRGNIEGCAEDALAEGVTYENSGGHLQKLRIALTAYRAAGADNPAEKRRCHSALTYRTKVAVADNKVLAREARDATAIKLCAAHTAKLEAPEYETPRSFNVFSLALFQRDHPDFELPQTPAVHGETSALAVAHGRLLRAFRDDPDFKRATVRISTPPTEVCRRGEVLLHFERKRKPPGAGGGVDVAADADSADVAADADDADAAADAAQRMVRRPPPPPPLPILT